MCRVMRRCWCSTEDNNNANRMKKIQFLIRCNRSRARSACEHTLMVARVDAFVYIFSIRRSRPPVHTIAAPVIRYGKQCVERCFGLMGFVHSLNEINSEFHFEINHQLNGHVFNKPWISIRIAIKHFFSHARCAHSSPQHVLARDAHSVRPPPIDCELYAGPLTTNRFHFREESKIWINRKTRFFLSNFNVNDRNKHLTEVISTRNVDINKQPLEIMEQALRQMLAHRK